MVLSEPLLASLLHLGLGRESILYHYVDDKRTFHPRLEDARMSGYSLATFQSLSASFIHYGNQTRRLKEFFDQAYIFDNSVPSLVACAGEISMIMSSLEAHIVSNATSVCSLLQLQSLFERPGQVLSCFSDLIATVQGARADEEVLSRLYDIVHNSEHEAAWIQQMLFNIMAGASRLWLERTGGWLGLRPDSISKPQGVVPGFVHVTESVKSVQGGREVTELDYELDLSSMPEFLSEDEARLVFETGRSLRLLQGLQPAHPLVRSTFAPMKYPTLDWQFSWHDIETISNLAEEYEFILWEAIKDFDINGGVERPIYRQNATSEGKTASKQTAKEFIDVTTAAFEVPLPNLTVARRSPHAEPLISDSCSEDQTFVPPISLLASLSFHPLISAQANLVNQACLRLLFKEHNIRFHFSLLYRYNLLGDGVFASRLSHALFDPELASAERLKGHSRSGTSGLKLGYRDTWPPANSELRLALMGILTDSLFPDGQSQTSSLFRAEMPGDLSFAIREMSEDELQRCMDPDSIEALDFLRVQYRPSAPLDAVISQASLIRYDAIFKLLLRAMRMLFVVNQVARDKATCDSDRRDTDLVASRFRIESRHFVSVVCNYFFDGITYHWGILENRSLEIEKALDCQDSKSGDSLPKLRDFHEQLLDAMTLTLLLRKRQAQVMNLLEEIFSLILSFARHVRTSDGNAKTTENQVDLKNLYNTFTKKVHVFIDVCRGLSERRGQGGTKDPKPAESGVGLKEDGENTIGQLLLRFEMSGFYSR